MALCVMLTALLTLIGTATGHLEISGWLPSTRFTAMGASAAFLIAGACLWTWTLRPLTRVRRYLARGLAFTVLLISFSALGYLLFLHLRGEPAVLSATAFEQHPNRMPPFTIIALLFFGWALAVPHWLLPHRRRPAEYLALAGTVLGFVMAMTYIYRLNLNGTTSHTTASSFPASLLMMMLGVGIITSHPTGLIGTLFAHRGIAGSLTRRIFLLLLLSPPLLGGLRMAGQRREWFDEGLGSAISIGAYVLIFGGVTLAFGHKLYVAEKQRKTTERRLLSQEFDAQVAFSNAPVGIGQLKTNYRWARINPQLAAIFDYPYEEFLTLPIEELVHVEDREACAARLQRLMAGEVTQFAEESRFIRKDGSRIWCNLTITIPAEARLKRRYAIVVMEDVTERKNAELEIVRQKAAAEAANRAKDRFISVISHELRTPLTPVLATLTAYPRADLTEEQQKILNMMQRNIEHEVCLIDDLLEVTRLSHGKLRLKKAPVNLHLLLTELFELLSNSFEEKGLRGVLSLRAERYNVLGDRARLRQVFLNLLDNARKFTPPGGMITVATRQEGDRILTRVTDTGAGIAPDAIARIFEAFEQGSQARARQFGGLGLGLAICKGLMEAHQGSIRVDSLGEGRGATFTVVLDTIDEEEALRTDDTMPEPRLGHILLVEDHDDTRIMLHHLLERRGHRVTSASTISEALSKAESIRPDLLLSDIGLPDGDGLTLRRLIHERCGLELPGIALSGFGNEADRSASAESGYQRHLVKPVDITQLERAIYEVLAEEG